MARHFNGTLGHKLYSFRTDIRGRNTGLARAQHDPQPDINPLCTLGLLKLSAAHFDRVRHPVNRHGIAGIRPGAFRGIQQLLTKVDQRSFHYMSSSAPLLTSNRRPYKSERFPNAASAD
jgi:hypothetical protein